MERLLPASACRPALQLLQYRGIVTEPQWFELCAAWEHAHRDAQVVGRCTEAEADVEAARAVRRLAAAMLARPREPDLGPDDDFRQRLGIFSPGLNNILNDPTNLW